MVSTSSRDTGGITGSIRNRNLTPAYILPHQQIPRIKISTQYGGPLESTLVPLARALFSFDIKLLRRVEILDQKDASCNDEARKKEALDRLEDIKELKKQWRDIDSFKHQFNQSYLTDGQFIPFWTKGLKHIRMVLVRRDASANHMKMREDYQSILWEYHECTDSLYKTLCDAVGETALEERTLELIRERWMKLDELFDLYFRVEIGEEDSKFSSLRTAPTWPEVRSVLRDRTQERFDQAQNWSKAEDGSLLAKVYDFPKGRIHSASIFWSALTICVFTSIVFFARGYAQSPHIKGSTNDYDFWFLLQSSITQIIGLGISVLLEWRNGSDQMRWVFPRGIAGACALAAIPFYLAVPTEWSSFLSQIAGLTQTFMICQHFLSSSTSP